MKCAVCLIVTLVVLGVICKFFPLFHIVPLKRAEAEAAAATFDPAAFADQFWSQKLVPSFDHAVEAKDLLATIHSDPAAAQKKYARTLSLGGGYFYYLHGKGRVLSTNSDGASLAIDANATNAEVVLATGLIFGNAVRDGTGLLNASDYSNLQDFNNISAALNKLVETRVLPELRTKAHVGATVEFVGCAEVDDETTDLNPLQVVPVEARIE